MIEQVLSKHYDNDGGVTAIDLIRDNNLDFYEGSVVKYICRWRRPGGGGMVTLRKAYTYLGWLIEREEARDRRRANNSEAIDLAVEVRSDPVPQDGLAAEVIDRTGTRGPASQDRHESANPSRTKAAGG